MKTTTAELLKTDPETLDAGELRQWLPRLRIAAGRPWRMGAEESNAWQVGVARLAALLGVSVAEVRSAVVADAQTILGRRL